MAGLSFPRFAALLLNVALLVVPAGFGWSWLWLRQDATTILVLGIFLAAVISLYRWGQRHAKSQRAVPRTEMVIAAVVAFLCLPAVLTYGLLLAHYTPVYLAALAIVVFQAAVRAARSLGRRLGAGPAGACASAATPALEVAR